MEVRGTKVRKLRNRLDLSQDALGTRSGVGRDVIAGIELGRRGTTFSKVEDIARVLGVDPESLVVE